MINWLKHRKLWQQIVLMILAFVVPLSAVTLHFGNKGINKDLEFARQEKKGNIFQRPLEALLMVIPQHLTLARQAAAGDASAQAALAPKQAEIDQAFALLTAADVRVGRDLQFTDEGLAKRKREGIKLHLVKGKWDTLRAQAGRLGPKELSDLHSSLVADVRTMVTHMGDTSNLILDPDLDSYYIMDITLLAIPQTQDRLGVILNYGLEVLGRANLTQEERQQLGIYAAVLKESDSDRIAASVQTALNEDKGAYGVSDSLQNNLPPLVKAYTAGVDDLIVLINKLSTEAKISVSANDWLVAGQKARAASSTLWKSAVDELDVLLDKRSQTIRMSGFVGLGVAALSVLVAGVVAFFFLRAITRSFNAMIEARIKAQQKAEDDYKKLQEGIQGLLMVTSDASGGDFTIRAKVTEGALGNVADAMNLMFENVSLTLKEVHAASTRVASAAMEIQAASEQLAQGSLKQASEIVNTTSAVQEMAANIESVSNNANAANDAASRARNAADEGSQAVTQVIEGMQRIRENVQVGAKKIKRLGERSMEISSIVSTISDISGQTDMLALNAAIEAARAGEHGRGFTVVAEEVRKLAERTGAATKEIEKLIAGIQAETNESVSSMEKQTSEVETEVKVVLGAGASLGRIREASVQSAELINEINLAAKQQVRGATGVVKAMEIVSDIAQQAQSGTGQTKRATETLTILAGDLTKSLGKFKLASN